LGLKSTQEQIDNEKLLESIYTPEKKEIWDVEMGVAGEKFINEKINFDQYMTIRSKLRARLGYP